MQRVAWRTAGRPGAHRRFFHSSSLKCGAAVTRQAVVSECSVVLTAVTCARHVLPPAAPPARQCAAHRTPRLSAPPRACRLGSSPRVNVLNAARGDSTRSARLRPLPCKAPWVRGRARWRGRSRSRSTGARAQRPGQQAGRALVCHERARHGGRLGCLLLVADLPPQLLQARHVELRGPHARAQRAGAVFCACWGRRARPVPCTLDPRLRCAPGATPSMTPSLSCARRPLHADTLQPRTRQYHNARRAHAQGGWHGVCFLRHCVCMQSGEGLAACHQAALSTPSAGCRPGPSPDTPRASAGLQSIQNRASSAPPWSRSSWG